MVHTRGKGARPEGFAEYQPPKRERNPCSQPALQTRNMDTQKEKKKEPKYKDASSQTSPRLTRSCEPHVVSASAKRRRDVDDDADRNSTKRTKVVTPERSKFLFSKTRNRSLLTSAPPKLGSRHESPFFNRMVEPASPESPSTESPQRPASVERVRPQPEPETPTRVRAQGGIFGSVRKIFGFFTGDTQGATETRNTSQQGSAENQLQLTTTSEPEEDDGCPTPTPPRRLTYTDPESPTPDREIADSNVFTRENMKRRRTANTIPGREQAGAMEQDDAPDFNPAHTPGSNKRKLSSVNGHIPGPKRGGFGIDDTYLDVDNHVEGIGESSLADTQPATPVATRPPATPLRSALRQNANALNIGRSAKSVRINSAPNSVKHVYGQYGPAGDYRGSTFADISSQATDSPSSLPWSVKDMHSPDTIRNTANNTPFRLDFSIKDPNDAAWRPSPANPRPGQFRLPDFDDEDDEGSSMSLDQVQGDVPPQPSTPRMSHAELPQPTPLSEISGFTGHTDSSIINDTQEIRLNKARSDAQKYKPAKSSRLSLSEQARSRSSSPPASDPDFGESQITAGTLGEQASRTHAPQDSTHKSTSAAKPLTREELDKTDIGEDGMTDYERAHQYDAWAEELFNEVVPQTYVEAGVVSANVHNLMRKTWTGRDTREAIEFWDKEFEDGLKAAKEAKAQGRELVWVTDPDEILALEGNGMAFD